MRRAPRIRRGHGLRHGVAAARESRPATGRVRRQHRRERGHRIDQAGADRVVVAVAGRMRGALDPVDDLSGGQIGKRDAHQRGQARDECAAKLVAVDGPHAVGPATC